MAISGFVSDKVSKSYSKQAAIFFASFIIIVSNAICIPLMDYLNGFKTLVLCILCLYSFVLGIGLGTSNATGLPEGLN